MLNICIYYLYLPVLSVLVYVNMFHCFQTLSHYIFFLGAKRKSWTTRANRPTWTIGTSSESKVKISKTNCSLKHNLPTPVNLFLNLTAYIFSLKGRPGELGQKGEPVTVPLIWNLLNIWQHLSLDLVKWPESVLTVLVVGWQADVWGWERTKGEEPQVQKTSDIRTYSGTCNICFSLTKQSNKLDLPKYFLPMNMTGSWQSYTNNKHKHYTLYPICTPTCCITRWLACLQV